MAYLGTIGIAPPDAQLSWTLTPIALVVLGEVLARYAAHGGYIYVK